MVAGVNRVAVGAAVKIPVARSYALVGGITSKVKTAVGIQEMNVQPFDGLQFTCGHRSCLYALERGEVIGGGCRACADRERDDSGRKKCSKSHDDDP